MSLNLAEKLRKTAGGVAAPEPLPKVTQGDVTHANCAANVRGNQGVMAAIFKDAPPDAMAWHTAFAGKPSDATASNWNGKPVNPVSAAGVDKEGLNHYFMLVLVKPDAKGEGRRESNFHSSYGVMLDDVGTKARTPSLPPSIVVQTSPGNCQYSYLFTEPVTDIALLKSINGELVRLGYCDSGAKSPTTRYQRLPFAVNGKTDPAYPCKLVEFHPQLRYSPQQIIEGLGLHGVTGEQGQGVAGKVREWPENDLAINADIEPQDDNTPKDFELIRDEREGCETVRWAADPENQALVEEPYWRGLLGIVKFCTGAEELAHEVSRHHPQYDRRETQRKLESWNTGPTTCDHFADFNPDACGRCKHRGRIKSPIMLDNVTENAPKTDPGASAIAQAVESGALQSIVDQWGALNYVETYERNKKTCRNVTAAGTTAATDLILTTVSTPNGRPPSQQAIAVAEARIRTAARRTGRVTRVHLRVAQVGEVRFHDLGPGRIARIDSEDWGIVDESGEDVPLFVRGTGAGELPDPTPFNGGAREALAHCLKHYRDLLGMSPEQALISVAVLLDRLDPATPHVIVENVGSAGSGKSTATEHDVNVIDPGAAEGLHTTKATIEDVSATAQQRYVQVFDNTSYIDKSLSDVLCIASTGGTLMARRFHAQAETIALELHCAVYITAVNPVCRETDLLTRAVRNEFHATPGREVIGVVEMRALFKAALPAFLGALYTLKSASLRVLPEVRQRKGWNHRMVTFDQTGEAMLTAAGYEPGAFQKLISEKREAMARRSASGDVFFINLCNALRIIQGWTKDAEEPPMGEVKKRHKQASVFPTITGIGAVLRPGILLELLPKSSLFEKEPAIPKTERALLDALRRVQPTLASTGVMYRELHYSGRTFARFEWATAALAEESDAT